MIAKISIDQALMKAKFHAKKNEINEAHKLYKAVLIAFPNNARAKQGLEALKLPKIVSKNQSPPQKIIENLVSIYKQHNFKAAQDKAQTILVEYPDSIIVWNILGIINTDLGYVEQAANAFRKVTQLNPYYAEGYNSLGNTLKALCKFDEAATCYNKAISLKPELAEVHSNLGLILEELGRFEEAEISFKKAVKLKPNLAEAYINLGKILLEQGKIDDAEASYNKAINLRPDKFPDAYDQLACILQKKEKFDEAEVFYKKCISLEPSKKTSSISIGSIYFKEGLLEQALSSFESYKTEVSRAQTLETLFALGRVDDIYKRLESQPDLYEGNLRVAAIAAFLAENEKKVTAHNFCKNPINFIHFGNLNSHIENYKSFISSVINDLNNVKTRWETNTTKNGFQAKTDVFKYPSHNISVLKNIILNELKTYYLKFKDESCSYITKWPSKLNINGWHVILKQQGYQTAHIHPDGWLSGVIYLKVVPSLGQNEGAIEFSLDGPNYPCENSSRRIYQPEIGDMVFFPSSLFHKTLPFSTSADRICIAFDLFPNTENTNIL